MCRGEACLASRAFQIHIRQARRRMVLVATPERRVRLPLNPGGRFVDGAAQRSVVHANVIATLSTTSLLFSVASGTPFSFSTLAASSGDESQLIVSRSVGGRILDIHRHLLALLRHRGESTLSEEPITSTHDRRLPNGLLGALLGLRAIVGNIVA